MEEAGFSIDDQSLFQIAVNLPVAQLLKLCQSDKRMSTLCRSQRLWLTRLTRDYPQIDYRQNFGGNPMHVYIAAYAADTLINNEGYIAIENVYLRMIISNSVSEGGPKEIQLKGSQRVPLFMTFAEKYPNMRVFYGFSVGSDVMATFESDDLVELANMIDDLVKSMELKYTDIVVRRDP
jgi:hypothetical protein